MRLSLPRGSDAGQCFSMDDTSKEVVYKEATSKEVENDTSFEEQLLETTSSQDYRNKEYEQATLKTRVEIKPSSTPPDLAFKITLIKAKLISSTLHEKKWFKPLHVCIDLMAVIIHLFFAKSVNNIAGTREDHKSNISEMKRPINIPNQNRGKSAPLVITPFLKETRRFPKSCLIKQEPPDLKAQAQIQGGAKDTTTSTMIPDQNQGMILSFLLKGEQLDAPHITKPKPYRGRGYDADIRTKPNREYGEPTSPHTKPVHEEHLGESFPKWSSDQSQREGLIIHHQINPKESNGSRGIKHQQVKLSHCWDMTVALFFPCLGFFPLDLPRKVFNEATPNRQGITYHSSDSKMTQEVIAEVLVGLLAGPFELLADRHAKLLADESDIIASYEEFRPFDTWTSPRGSPHTYLIHHKSPAHGEQLKRRPKSKPPFESSFIQEVERSFGSKKMVPKTLQPYTILLSLDGNKVLLQAFYDVLKLFNKGVLSREDLLDEIKSFRLQHL
ncbi:PREDICTED: uncharacterized protein LOC104743505 [Camelina sativa]|uniref:Uncharacterized protein LOC104743505 n=1 Tax=Camelina sativa TaxID=90675 RepID=A0ABM0VY39_CAMSA|nr:PREDICTED: uncharacterized protein LOC104743505 [Camelina sativa]